MNIGWAALKDVAAIVGCVLGIFNFIQVLLQRRVRLRVIPKLTTIRGGGFFSSNREPIPDGFACIEVINLSSFPVTLAEVGFSLFGDTGRKLIIPDPKTLLPLKLESRQSIDVRSPQSAGFPHNGRRAYARTQCGHTSYGDSPVFKQFRRTSSGNRK